MIRLTYVNTNLYKTYMYIKYLKKINTDNSSLLYYYKSYNFLKIIHVIKIIFFESFLYYKSFLIKILHFHTLGYRERHH